MNVQNAKNRNHPAVENLSKGVLLNFYLYELTKTPYKDKKGNNKFSLKTERVTHSGFNIKYLLTDFMKSLTQYFKHRFYFQNGKYHWKKILNSVSEIGLIFHLDYSENLQTTPKFEPQSAHSNERQHSLHCAVTY